MHLFIKFDFDPIQQMLFFQETVSVLAALNRSIGIYNEYINLHKYGMSAAKTRICLVKLLAHRRFLLHFS